MLLLQLRRTKMTHEHPSRRDVLKQLGLIVGAAAGLPVMPARAQARTQGLPAVSNAYVALTPTEAETLRAVIARIIPSDENGPGALEARADRFIDRALAGALKAQRAAYTTGLASLDAYSRTSKGSAFKSLSASDQDAILTDVQANRAAGFTGGSAVFFNLLRTHTIQGTFSDPFYGGNDNFIGWDLIGYPGSRIVVSANQQRMDVKPEPSRKSAYDYGMFTKGEF
jgi:gluconate 2-dehydrogenase gamma chain